MTSTLAAGPLPLTRGQKLTFLSLLAPWLVFGALVAIRPTLMELFLKTGWGVLAVIGFALLTAAQVFLLRAAFRRMNRSRANNGGYTTVVLQIFGTAVLGAIELLAVVFGPALWSYLARPLH